MNCLTYLPDNSINTSTPFFEEPVTRTCKVYCDGGHYIAVPPSMSDSKKRKTVPRGLYSDMEPYYLEGISLGLSGKKLSTFVYDRYVDLLTVYSMCDNFTSMLIPGADGSLIPFCGASDLEDKLFLSDVRSSVDVYISNKAKLVSQRKKRFRRKANLNEWNYFVTFTYDDDKHDEESFRVALRKSLSNLHTRRGWTYMGVFERAPETGRLHFHGLFNIPEGEMPGELDVRREYSTKRHKMLVTTVNTFFEATFGRNDFSAISSSDLRHGNTLKYILKYIEKTGERIVYSRGIPSEIYVDVSESDVAAKLFDFVEKWILFDDAVDSFGPEPGSGANLVTSTFPLSPLPS